MLYGKKFKEIVPMVTERESNRGERNIMSESRNRPKQTRIDLIYR